MYRCRYRFIEYGQFLECFLEPDIKQLSIKCLLSCKILVLKTSRFFQCCSATYTLLLLGVEKSTRT